MTTPPVVPGQQPAWAPHPPEQQRHRGRRLVWVAAIVVGAAVGGTVFAYRAFAPAGFPGIAPEDSGIEACEALRDSPVDENGNQARLTEQRYQELRKLFAGSGYPDLRDSGTKMMDTAWRISQDQTTVLANMGQVMDAGRVLQSACAEHDVIMPGG